MKQFKLKSRIYWIKIAVGILLLIVIYKKINQQESVLGVLTSANPLYVLAALLLLIPHFYIAFFKWRYLLRIRFSDISNHETFSSLLFGITLGMVTPGNLGELGRGLFFKDKNRTIITGLTVVDKLSNMLIFATLGFVSISVFILNHLEWSPNLELITLVGGTAFLGSIWLLLLKKSWIKSLLNKAATLFPENPKIQAFMAAFKHIRHRHVFVALSLTLIWIFIITLQYHMLILGFTDVTLAQSAQAVTAALFTKMLLPFSFGGLGIREGVTVFYFSQFNISSAAVFNASLIVFFVNFLLPALIGFYHVLRLNGKRKQTQPFPFENYEPELHSELEK